MTAATTRGGTCIYLYIKDGTVLVQRVHGTEEAGAFAVSFSDGGSVCLQRAAIERASPPLGKREIRKRVQSRLPARGVCVYCRSAKITVPYSRL